MSWLQCILYLKWMCVTWWTTISHETILGGVRGNNAVCWLCGVSLQCTKPVSVHGGHLEANPMVQPNCTNSSLEKTVRIALVLLFDESMLMTFLFYQWTLTNKARGTKWICVERSLERISLENVMILVFHLCAIVFLHQYCARVKALCVQGKFPCKNCLDMHCTMQSAFPF